MKKRTLLATAVILFSASFSFSQTSGILPLNGIQYFYEGIYAKYAEVKVDGVPLTNNRLPLNKEFSIVLELPTGFTEDAAKKIYPAAELSFLNNAKQPLANMGNVMKASEQTGFASRDFKALEVKASLQASWLKNETSGFVQVKYYDLKSKKQMRLLIPVMVASAAEPMALSRLSSPIKTTDASVGISNSVKIKSAEISVDTSIRVSPKTAYLSIEIPGMEGTSMEEVLGGKNSFWVYDKNMNEVKIAEKLLKKVGGSMESGLVNYTVKVPFKVKTDNSQAYTIRYRWESTDKKKLIDIVATK